MFKPGNGVEPARWSRSSQPGGNATQNVRANYKPRRTQQKRNQAQSEPCVNGELKGGNVKVWW